PATRHLSCHEPAPTEIYTLSLHDALPISKGRIQNVRDVGQLMAAVPCQGRVVEAPWNQLDPDSFQPLFLELPGQFLLHRPPLAKDRKSTRLNSSHDQISYAVFCLKKKMQKTRTCRLRPANKRERPASV